jgi:integrase
MKLWCDFPIVRLQAQFEYFTLKVYNRALSKKYGEALSTFFSYFKERENPEDFYRQDIQDYTIIREREGVHPNQVRRELEALRAFWNWMIEQKDLPLFGNIVSVRGPRYPRKQKDRISLKDFMRLLSEVHDPRLMGAIRLTLQSISKVPDEEYKKAFGISKNSLGCFLRRACERSGIRSCGLSRLPHALHHAALQLLLPEFDTVASDTPALPVASATM